MFSLYTCSDDEMHLDVPSDCLHMSREHFNTKYKDSRGYATPLKDKIIDKDIKKIQVKRRQCETSFPMCKKIKKSKTCTILKELIDACSQEAKENKYLVTICIVLAFSSN